MSILRPTLLAVAVSCFVLPALVYEAGDTIIRFGPALVGIDNGVGFTF